MSERTERLQRRLLDSQFAEMRRFGFPPSPAGGWVRAIRQSLGMNLRQFAQRLGVSAPTALQLEKAEASGSVTLKRLRQAADALECDVVVLVIPRVGLDEMVRLRATSRATSLVDRVNHSMMLERQGVAEERLAYMVGDLADDLVRKSDSSIWD